MHLFATVHGFLEPNRVRTRVPGDGLTASLTDWLTG